MEDNKITDSRRDFLKVSAGISTTRWNFLTSNLGPRALRTLIKDQVGPAYQRMHDFVREQYIPKARKTTAWSALPDGKAWYAYRVKRSTTTAMSPDAIYALGQHEVRRILAEMDQVRREVKFEGDLKAFFAHLQNDPRYYYTKPVDQQGGYLLLSDIPNNRIMRYDEAADERSRCAGARLGRKGG